MCKFLIVVKSLVFGRSRDLHICYPVHLIGLQSEERLVLIDNKFGITALRIGKEINARLDFFCLILKNELTFFINKRRVVRQLLCL